MKRVFDIRVEASAREGASYRDEHFNYWIEGDNLVAAHRRALQLAQREVNGNGLPRRALRVVRVKELGTIDAAT